MAVLLGSLVNRDNVADDATLQLEHAYGVHTLVMGNRTFVYVAGQFDDGISGFELMSDGTLSNVENIEDTPTLELATNFASVTVGANTYLYVNSDFDDGLSVFKVAADGTLTSVQNITDVGALELEGADSKMTVASISGVNYLVVTGFDDDGISVFSIAVDGTLTNTDNIDNSSSPTLELNGANDTAMAVVGVKTFIFAAGLHDDGVTAFELQAGGMLVETDAVDDSSLAALELAGASGVATAEVGGTTYLFVSASNDDGISVFSVSAAGTLNNVFNLADTPALGLHGASGLNIFMLGEETFLSVSANSNSVLPNTEEALSVFHVAINGSLTEIDTVTDTGSIFLYGSRYHGVTGSEAATFLISAGRFDDGISSFELGGGVDTLTGGIDNDTIFGLGGDDILTGGRGADTIFGGDGDDVIVAGGSVFGDGADTVFGGAGDDQITGGFYVDVLNGGDGEDTFYIGGAFGGFGDNHDVIDGGNDTDTLDLRGFTASQGFNVNLLNETYDVITMGISSAQSIKNVENVDGTSNDDILTGDGGSNLLSGGDGDDNLTGGGGGDFLEGDDDQDTLSGGAGQDVLLGGAGEDWLYGDDGDDVLVGGTGLDRLFGGTGMDILIGGLDSDILNGGAGTDDEVLDGGADIDTADYSDATSDTTVILFNRDGIAQSTVSSGRDTLIDIENITGSDFNDKLIGDAGGNIIRGGIGNDTIDGVGGGDLLRGDAGNDGFRARGGVDDFNGGADTDFVNYDASTGVNAFLDGSGTNGRAAAGDTFVDIENLVGSSTGGDLLYGDAEANRLTGLGGADTLRGRAGIDQLEGGAGDDTLIGDQGADVYVTGIGSDTIVFNLAPDAGNRDRITDFTSGQDTLQIEASVFGGGLVAGATVQLIANGNPTAIDPGGTFLYDTDSGLLRFDADGNGAGGAELFVWLQNIPTLLTTDFDVVA